MASLTGELRSATVMAIDDVEVLVIRDADFDRCASAVPRSPWRCFARSRSASPMPTERSMRC